MAGSSPLDPFIPRFDARERYAIRVRAPAALVQQVARDFDMQSVPLVRAIIRAREIVMGGAPSARRPRGLMEELTSMGWGILRDEPGRLLACGAACQPWLARVIFTPVPAERFAAHAEPGQVRIAWTLETRELGEALTELISETRVVANDEASRRRFLAYWRWARFGIIPIRWLLLPAVARKATAAFQSAPRTPSGSSGSS